MSQDAKRSFSREVDYNASSRCLCAMGLTTHASLRRIRNPYSPSGGKLLAMYWATVKTLFLSLGSTPRLCALIDAVPLLIGVFPLSCVLSLSTSLRMLLLGPALSLSSCRPFHNAHGLFRLPDGAVPNPKNRGHSRASISARPHFWP